MNKFEKVSYEEYDHTMTNNGHPFDNQNYYDNIILPRRGTKSSAGYDIRTPIQVTIDPGDTVLIPTGVKASIDDDKVLIIVPRSSMGIKKKCMMANTVGIIDSDYYNNPSNEGHIMIALTNTSHSTPVKLEANDRICQCIFMAYYTTDDDNSKTTREGGIGSTGSN
jgi:dUTP pyrophosphatase